MTGLDPLPLSLPIAFLLGLSSTFHCWGMCGGILGALTLGVSPVNPSGRRAALSYAIAFNAGRILSYAMIGALAGLGGAVLSGGRHGGPGYLILQAIAGILLVLIGLHVSGWAPALSLIEAAGVPIWRRIQPLGKRLLPVDSAAKAVLIGMLWGWVPCGLVYSVVLWSVSAADAVLGAAVLLSFGLGTLPGMVGAGLAGGYVRDRLATPGLRRLAGITLIALGVLSPAVHLLLSGTPAPEDGMHVHP